ncbi:MAG: hypothetical protein AAB553_00665 [Patescibacteria group bacterium]
MSENSPGASDDERSDYELLKKDPERLWRRLTTEDLSRRSKAWFSERLSDRDLTEEIRKFHAEDELTSYFVELFKPKEGDSLILEEKREKVLRETGERIGTTAEPKRLFRFLGAIMAALSKRNTDSEPQAISPSKPEATE